MAWAGVWLADRDVSSPACWCLPGSTRRQQRFCPTPCSSRSGRSRSARGWGAWLSNSPPMAWAGAWLADRDVSSPLCWCLPGSTRRQQVILPHPLLQPLRTQQVRKGLGRLAVQQSSHGVGWRVADRDVSPPACWCLPGSTRRQQRFCPTTCSSRSGRSRSARGWGAWLSNSPPMAWAGAWLADRDVSPPACWCLPGSMG